MKYVIMTEGVCEKALLDVLLDCNLLRFDRSELLFEEVHQARQLNEKLMAKINQLPYDETITIIRVGDLLSDTLKINKTISTKIENIKKICIKPEFEILHIIDLGKINGFTKVKTKMKASVFLGNHIKYKKSYEYNKNYFASKEPFELIKLLELYVKYRGGTHKKDEDTLLDYIRR